MGGLVWVGGAKWSSIIPRLYTKRPQQPEQDDVDDNKFDDVTIAKNLTVISTIIIDQLAVIPWRSRT